MEHMEGKKMTSSKKIIVETFSERISIIELNALVCALVMHINSYHISIYLNTQKHNI